MRGLRRSAFGHGVLAAAAFAVPTAAFALVIAENSLTVSDIGITFDQPGSGSIAIRPWTAEASASALNSRGQVDGAFDSSPTAAAVDATVSFASASARADAIQRSVHVMSEKNNADAQTQADTTARGGLFTTFFVGGGVGEIAVEFSMTVQGLQRGMTDGAGSFHSEVVASLELDGDPLLFRQQIVSGGPNFADQTTPLLVTLSATRTLTFGESYFVYIEADSELTIPEPAVAAFGAAALVLLAWYLRRRNLPRTDAPIPR